MKLDKEKIDIDIINSYSFYARYGIADLIFEFSEFYDISVEDVIDQYYIDDLVDFYNDIYKLQIMEKFRIFPTFNKVDDEITYDYIGSKIFNVDDKENLYYVSSMGLASKSVFLSPNILSTAGAACKNLFSVLQKDMSNKSKTKINSSISPFTTCVVNRHKPSYDLVGSIVVIGNLLSTTTTNKFYFRNNNYNPCAIIPDYENFMDYFKIIEYTRNKNIRSLFKATKCNLNDENKNKRRCKPPIILDGNIDTNMTYPFDYRFKFIDFNMEYYNNVYKSYKRDEVPKATWYSIGPEGDINLLEYNEDILEVSIRFDIDFKGFSKNLLIDLFDEKNMHNLYNFYKYFDYKRLRKLFIPITVKGVRTKLDIKNDNQIIIKFLNNMKKNDNDKIKSMTADIKRQIHFTSKEKASNLLGTEEGGKYKELKNKYSCDISHSILHLVENSNDISEFLLRVTKFFSKYKLTISLFNGDNINYILNDLEDFEEFKKVFSIYLYTNLYEEFLKSKVVDDKINGLD